MEIKHILGVAGVLGRQGRRDLVGVEAELLGQRCSQLGVTCALVGTTKLANAQRNVDAVAEGPLPAEAIATALALALAVAFATGTAVCRGGGTKGATRLCSNCRPR